MGISCILANSICLWMPEGFYKRKGKRRAERNVEDYSFIRCQFLENMVLSGRFLFPMKPVSF